MSEYILDTNAAIARIQQESTLIALLEDAERIYLPVIVVGELRYGAEKSQRKEENLANVDALVEQATVLECDLATTKEYGAIRYQLERKGQKIPVNDLWIAAIAQQYNLTIITRDKHFDNVESIDTLAW